MSSQKRRYGKKRECPCPKAKKNFCPLLDDHGRETGDGWCWTPNCTEVFTQVFPDANQTNYQSNGETTTRHHVYHDRNGKPYMRITVVKKHGGEKNAFAERWDGVQWFKGVDGIERIPYRLPQLLERIALEGVVVVVEGEKDADNADQHGITATCNPFGAMKWTDALSEYLVGARIVIIPDNDDAGMEHALTVKASLERVGVACAGILDLRTIMPDIPSKGDLTDFLERGGNAHVLRNAIDEIATKATDSVEDATIVPLPSLQWQTLPRPLRELSEQIEDERQRIAFLMASIAVIGGLLPKVHTLYHGHSFSPSLYLFVVGPPGSGKGALLPAELLAQRVDREIRDAYTREMENYNKAYAKWKSGGKKNGDAPPSKPTRKMLMVPADSTGPVIIRAVCENAAVILFDSEGDSLQTALRAETGDASPALRKAWQGERVSQARIGNDVFVSTDNPHLAIVLTGTPDQVPVLIRHVTTGLTSRFCFMEFPEQREFRDPFVHNANRIRTIARDVAVSIRNLWRFALDHGDEAGFCVETNAHQKSIFNTHFGERFQDRIESADAATTLRSGIVTMRVALVLTVVRRWFESQHLDPVMSITNADFDFALALGEFFRQGTDSFIARLTSRQRDATLTPTKRRTRKWYDELPVRFTTQDAIEYGQRSGVGRSTVYELLKQESHFRKVSHGKYEKKVQRHVRGP